MQENIDQGLVRGRSSLSTDIRSFSFYIAAFIIMFMSSILIISTILFFFHFHLHSLVIPESILLSSAGLWLILTVRYKQKTPFMFLVILCSFIIIVSLSLALSGLFYDSSWDGQDYHQPAIIALADGWNPAYESFPRSVTFDSEAPVWIDHYPKASWILEASIYQVTGFIEVGKCINIMFLFVAVLFVLAALCAYGRLRLLLNIPLSIVIACTPVFCYQFLSFYVDDLVSCIVVSQFALCALILLDDRNTLPLWMLAILIVFSINVKFTGIVFSFIIVAGLLVFYFVKHKKPGALLKPALVCAFAALFAIAFVGFNPYITNTIAHGNPLYPVFGKDSKDVVTLQKPANFVRMNAIESFCYSLFSESGTDHQQNADGFQPARLKAPFTIGKNEIKFSNSDPRAGGFGTMFGGMLLVSLLLLVIHFVRLIIGKRIRDVLVHAGIIAWILASVLVIPDSWWARWVPQLWILPFVIVIMSAGTGSSGDSKGKKTDLPIRVPVIALQAALFILALLNNGIILDYYLNLNGSVSIGVRNELAKLAGYRGEVAVFAYKFDGAIKARLRDIHTEPYDVDYINGADYKDVVSCSTSFGYAMLGVPKVSRAELGKLTTADMPSDASVIEPSRSIPESARAFSGVWKGKLSGVIDSIVIVSKINEDLSADVVASIGECKPAKTEKGQYGLRGTITLDPRLSMHLTHEDFEYTLLMGDDLYSMELISSGKNTGGTGYLRRINAATNKPYLDFTPVSGDLPPLLSTELPFPEQIETTEPDPSLPDSIRGFYGLWEGKLGGLQDAAIFVTRISRTDADLLLSWGPYSSTRKGFLNMVGQVVMSDPPELYSNNAYGIKIRLIPGTSGYTLEGRCLVRWYSFSSAFMHKRSWTNR